jgi:drug/metabolite transporter (DMT)-like permease
MKDRQKGILVAVFGVLCFTPDAALVIFLSKKGVDPWTIIFWKLFYSGVIAGAYAVYSVGGLSPLVHLIRQAKWYHLAASLPQSASIICFTFALMNTSTAHALLLINLNPLWCALLGRLLLQDVLPWYTKSAMGGAMACMLIIFVPEIMHGSSTTDASSSSSKGYIFSVASGLLMATFITVIRKGEKMGYNLIGTAPIGSFLWAAVALLVRLGNVGPVDSAWGSNTQWQFWLAMVGEGAMMGIGNVTLTIAPKLITGSEVALVLLLEVLLGPFWVWLIYNEAPSVWTLVGGFGLIAVLALHEAMPLLLGVKQEPGNAASELLEKDDGKPQLGTEHKSCSERESDFEDKE